MGVQCPPYSPTGDAPLWDSCTTWKPSWNAKSPPNYKLPCNKPWTTTNPSATIVAWPCIAIIAGIELVYGGEAPHQLSLLHLLLEYRRNIGKAGFAAARRLLNAGSLAEGRE